MSAGDITARWFRDQSIQLALTCSSDGALVTIPYTIEQTHDGRFFFASYYNAAVAAAANIDMLIVTGATTTPHIGIMVDTGAQGVMSVYEGVTASSNGTPVTVFNANRASTKTSTATAFYTPTITGTGTAILPARFVNGGRGNNAIGSSSGDFARITELILLPSTKYLFRFTNTSAGATPVSMQLGWFEEV